MTSLQVSLKPSAESQECIDLQSPVLSQSIDELIDVTTTNQQSINELPHHSVSFLSPFGTINRSLDGLIDSSLIESTIETATETMRRESTINQSMLQMTDSFNDWSNAELDDLLNGTNQTSYYQVNDQTINQMPRINNHLLNESIEDLKQISDHPVQPISLPHQLSSLHSRTVSASVKQSIALSTKQSINEPKSYEEQKEQHFGQFTSFTDTQVT